MGPWLSFHSYAPRPLHVPARYAAGPPCPDPPKISIVTPSLDQGRFLERTLRSVLDQHYPRLEYVVQDGGSTDGSLDVIRAYAGRLTHWESSTDGGQAHAINRGFARTRGEIMAYLNSDDLLLPGSLDYVARYFAAHRDVDAVYGHRVVIDEHDRETGRWVLPPHDGGVLSWGDYIPQETLFWRRALWDRVGGRLDEEFQFTMDWDLLLRFRDAGARFVRLPRFLGAFRVHPAQKTSARLADVGLPEMRRLRMRCHARHVSMWEARWRLAPYLCRHIVCHRLYQLGVLRY
jgi:glycosyltransferase involved in cell wall biosynthesis